MATRKNPGDFTGNQKVKLQAEAQKQKQEQERELTMITAQEATKKSTEIVDYSKKKQAAVVDTGPVDLTITPDDGDDETINKIVASTRSEQPPAGDIVETTDLTAEQSRTPDLAAPVQVGRTSVKVRARYDMDKVTVGKGTFYDFEEGRQYLVPPHVAEHLSELERVDILN